MKNLYLRALRAAEPDQQAKEGPIDFIASTEGIKRDGLDITIEQWDLRNYKKNPVVLWGHDYGGWGSSPRPPIGRASVVINKERSTLDAAVTFDMSDEFAASIDRKYREGFLNAVSVGWNFVLPPGKSMGDVNRDEVKADLLDISGVPVPGDPDALKERYFDARSFTRVIVGGPQPPQSTKFAPLDTAFTPDLRDISAMQLRAMAAWIDPDIHPDSLVSYRFLHHLPEGEAVWAGVAASMAELYLGSAQMPEEERRGVFTHLARHYHQFSMEPPEYLPGTDLALLSAREIRGLFVAGEAQIAPETFARAGAIMSKRNLDDLDSAITLLSGIKERAAKKDEPEKGDDEGLISEEKVQELRGLFENVFKRG